MRTIDLPSNPSGHAAPLTHVSLSPDAGRLATSSYDGTVCIWDLADPTAPVLTERLRHRRLVNASAWNPAAPKLLATASADKTVAVWRIRDDGPADLINVLARHTDDINSVAWMPDGERLICVSEDGRATLWDAMTGAFLGEVGSHAAHCMMVSVSPDGLVATVGEDGMVAVSEPGSGEPPRVRHYEASVEGCAWSHSGLVLAVARDDGTVVLLDRELGEIRSVPVSRSAARAVAWADDDASFVVGAYDGSLHFLAADGTLLHEVRDRRVWPRSVSVAGPLVAAGSFWSGPHLFDLATAVPVSEPATPNHGPNALAVQGEDLLVGCDSGTVLAVRLHPGHGHGSGGRQVEELHLTDGPVLALAVLGDAVYAGTYSGHVLRYDRGGGPGQGTASSLQLGAPVPSLCVDGGRLVAGTYGGELIVLDPVSLRVVERHGAHDGSVKSLAPLGSRGFLSAATDRTIAVGAGPTGRSTLWEHGNLVNAVAALGDGVAASASRDHTVKAGRFRPDGDTWRLTDVQTLLGPDESVKCVALLGGPDAPVVLAGSYDFGLYTWTVDWEDGAGTLASGRVLAEFGQGMSCMTPLDGGTRVAAASWDGSIVVVGLDPADGTARIEQTMHVTELAPVRSGEPVAAS
ncbi:WD40 repeat domain-containing protein [Streptomyces sp. NPDC012888]|uniref:WD40 repeat domain-containing protein n=1 Tax=Streptomyces sp. NPDC012888 TaxID=3364855 RepID=UPI0036A3DB02